MLRTVPVVISAALVLSSSPAQHDGDVGKVARKSGTIYKHEVDGLIGALRSSARAGVAKPAAKGVLGCDVASTAKILTAMGHCHRRYHVSDGPVVRPSLDYLLKNRKADGSFGDRAATAWTLSALAILNSDGYEDEIQVGRRWLSVKKPVAGFEHAVADVLERVRFNRYPQSMADDAAKQAHRWGEAIDTIQREQAADALVQLVACQAANRQLDKMAKAQGMQKPWSESQQKAFAWLFSQQKGGIFSVTMPMKDDAGNQVMRSFPDPAFTGFGLMALQSKPKAKRTASEQDAIDAGLAWLLTQQNEDGTFGQQVPNYTTCVVVGALTRWKNPATAGPLKKAQKAILMFQNSENGGYQRSDRDYGSIGYGNSQRGDLSNLHFSIEALRATGLPENHEALQKALVFLQRTQNLKSSNDFSGKVPHPDKEGETLDVTSGDDGGATYYPGNSNAGYLVQPDGKAIPRSYGSMTYALLKSYTLAGVKGDDPRVQAAVKWIGNNWTVAFNPGSDPALGEKVKFQGLFYYYMVLGQALDAAGVDKIDKVTKTKKVGDLTEVHTIEVDWRKELRDHLAGMQQKDGTWINGKNGRWMENLPLLCTCYAMIALEHCQ